MTSTATGFDFQVLPDGPLRTPAEREQILANPVFGEKFSDHMVVVTWSADRGWHDAVVKPYGPFTLDPATAVLHYAQEIFEGLKAYRHADGSVWLFRAECNAARFNASCDRMALPRLPEGGFVAAVETLVRTDAAWVPNAAETSLYVRPMMFASEAFLGVRPARTVTFAVIASPVGSYFGGDLHPVSIWVSKEYCRAAPGGTGAAKCGPNYAGTLAPQQLAYENGCDQVAFLDATERRYLEELGGMNIFIITRDGELATPELTGTFLEGITRDAILRVGADLGLRPVERPIALDEVVDGLADGTVTEVFASGTAAVITPIGRLAWADGQATVADGGTGDVTARLRERLLAIQYGHAEDPYGWMSQVVGG